MAVPSEQERSSGIFEESGGSSKSLSSRRRRKLQRSQVQVMLQREKGKGSKLKEIFSASKPSKVNVHIPGTKLKESFSEQVNEASERSRKVEKAPKKTNRKVPNLSGNPHPWFKVSIKKDTAGEKKKAFEQEKDTTSTKPHEKVKFKNMPRTFTIFGDSPTISTTALPTTMFTTTTITTTQETTIAATTIAATITAATTTTTSTTNTAGDVDMSQI